MKMRKSKKIYLSIILMSFSTSLFSCTSKNYLDTFDFDVSYIGEIEEENREASIKLLSSKNDFIGFFSSDLFKIGTNFEQDIDKFDNEFGFDNFSIVYFVQLLNATSKVEASIVKTNSDGLEINFEYSDTNSDVYLPAEHYYQQF